MLNGINAEKFEALYNMGKIEKKTYQSMLDIRDRLKDEMMPKALEGENIATIVNELEEPER